MSATVHQFPAPDWADIEASSAVNQLDKTTVFWVGRDHSQNPELCVRLVKVDALDEDGRWSALDAELSGRGGDITLHSPQELDDLIAALQRLSTTWRTVEEVES